MVLYAIGAASAPSQVSVYATGEQDDLELTIAGTGIALGGDGASTYPYIYIPSGLSITAFPAASNPLTGVPSGFRPIPTGTAIDAAGRYIAFYSVVTYTGGAYISNNSTVVDLANPSGPVYTLTNMCQVSGCYNSANSTMNLVGNMSPSAGAQRYLFVVPIICPTCPSFWKSAASTNVCAYPFRSDGRGMNGDRENQIVALPGGGFLLVAAADNQPVTTAAADTPGGLLNAPATVLLTDTQFPSNQYPYGPTVTAMSQNGAVTTVTVQVSTGGPGDTYAPVLWTSQFTVTS